MSAGEREWRAALRRRKVPHTPFSIPFAKSRLLSGLSRPTGSQGPWELAHCRERALRGDTNIVRVICTPCDVCVAEGAGSPAFTAQWGTLRASAWVLLRGLPASGIALPGPPALRTRSRPSVIGGLAGRLRGEPRGPSGWGQLPLQAGGGGRGRQVLGGPAKSPV